jgi:putative DNA primase/helicase
MDFKEVNSLLLERSQEFCEEFLPGGQQEGAHWVCGSVEGEEGRSCKINLQTGVWADFAKIEEHKGGDLISLCAAVHDCSQAEAKRMCKEWLNGKVWDRPKPTQPENRADASSREPIASEIEHAHTSIGLSSAAPVRASLSEGDDPLWWRWFKSDVSWDYTDAKGNVLFQVKRWNARPEEGRSKVIRPWNPETRKYEYPEPGKRPLLSLPTLLKHDGPVVIVGGEKCADAVNEVGWFATTCAGGEGAISKTDCTP